MGMGSTAGPTVLKSPQGWVWSNPVKGHTAEMTVTLDTDCAPPEVL